MKILPVSDLHFEFHADAGAALLDDLTKDVDVIIVAGDLATSPLLFDALEKLSNTFERVLYVPGNHDWFHTSRSGMERIRQRIEASLSNVSWLDRDVALIDGQRFVGTTLWFPDSKAARRWTANMPDFSAISGFEEWIWGEFEKNRAFLNEHVQQGDVVITHHLPSPRSIADRFVNAPLNCYFVGNVEEIVRERGARFWIHGHTHECCDYVCGQTRVLCNPFGYPKGMNRGFRERLLIGVQPAEESRAGAVIRGSSRAHASCAPPRRR